MQPFSYRFRVPFADSDAAGIVHFSRVFPHVEAAEAAWLASLGVAQYREQDDGTRAGFAKVSVHCDYRSPLRPGDEVEVRLQATRVGECSLTYSFTATVGDKTAAEGSITVIHAVVGTGSTLEKRPLPAALRTLS